MLKLDPKNTELLNQKQTVLNQSISTTEEKLKELQNIKEEADKKMAEGTKVSEENYRNLQREIINTQNKLSNLKNEASNWTKAGEKLTQWGENLNKISSSINSLGNKLTTRLTLPLAAAATAGITYDAQIEKYETAFKTFLGSAEEAAKAIKNIKDDAKRTPFDTTSLVKANQMLISTGVSADSAREDILALGEAVIATGGGNDELTRMASNLQQIKNAGKATAMDIRQFAYAGIDVYGILADYLGKTTQEVKDMEISYDDLTKALKKASSEGGKYFGAMANSSETLTGQVSALKSEAQDGIGELTKSLMPIAKKVVAKAREIIKVFDGLSDSQKENIVKIGLMVAAAGPLLKIGSSAINIVGNVAKGLGTFSKAVSLAKNGIGDATGSAATLAKVFQGLTSPVGLAALGITAAVTAIVVAIKKAEEETKQSLENMAKGASEFVSGINSANSHLEEFNSTLFASSEEQQKLQEDMDNVQSGITEICKRASEERRDYTQEEITQLNEYFEKLRELKNRELEIQQSISKAITQQAEQNSKTFQGNLNEYRVQSQEWIKTAEEQAKREISIINERTTQEIALLQQRYGEKATLENEEYAREFNLIQENKNKAIEQANSQVAQVNQIYATGYAERTAQDNGFLNTVKEYNSQAEEENSRFNQKMQEIEDGNFNWVLGKNKEKTAEASRHNEEMKNIWNNMYNNMSEEQEKELGTWLAMVAQTEMYGGEIDEETKKTVNNIISSYNKMPKETREAMKNAMQPMLEEMQNKEPSLFAKASGIANGILSRLKNAFDIHSPSRETRSIFQNVMKGAELGLDDEENKLNKKIEDMTNKMKTDFGNIMPNMSQIKQSVIDQTRTIFTTPQIVFNVQELDEARLQQCFNYVNRKFGSAY
ncbi:tape measure protein [Faecalibacillus faecis]|uniref:tape measure protein n=1 Tax=Faecalibacillus faecis TaxID=1982628 RepID=UPI0038706891